MKIFSSPLMLLLGGFVVGMLQFGCSPVVRENALLEQSRSAFADAQSDPAVQKNAPLELQKAKLELDQAEKLLKAGAETPEVEHFAYLAKQRTAIAREATNVKLAEQAVDASAAERNAVLLKARTQEAEQAVQLAEAQKNEARIAGERADAARLHAGAMIAAADKSKAAADKSKAEADKSKAEADKSKAEADKSKAEALAAEEQARKLETQIAELQATKSERGLVITLGDVLFDTNKSELSSGAGYTIDKLAAFLTEYPGRNVLIEGFTDSTGGVEYNQRLSELRAEEVRDVLASTGIDSRRLMTRGYGVGFPVAGNETAEGRQRNRRVEVVISDDDGRIMER